MKRTLKVFMMVGIAITVGVGVVYAVTSDDRIRGTLWGWYDGTGEYSELNQVGLFMTTGNNTIRAYAGTDKINLGPDWDALEFSYGADVISMGGSDNQTEVITFDHAGYGVNAADNSKVFIRADYPETSPKITVCADDIVFCLGKE